MSVRPPGAHEYAVAEQRLKSFVTLGDEWFKLRGREIVNISDDDRAFLIQWGHMELRPTRVNRFLSE